MPYVTNENTQADSNSTSKREVKAFANIDILKNAKMKLPKELADIPQDALVRFFANYAIGFSGNNKVNRALLEKLEDADNGEITVMARVTFRLNEQSDSTEDLSDSMFG